MCIFVYKDNELNMWYLRVVPFYLFLNTLYNCCGAMSRDVLTITSKQTDRFPLNLEYGDNLTTTHIDGFWIPIFKYCSMTAVRS